LAQVSGPSRRLPAAGQPPASRVARAMDTEKHFGMLRRRRRFDRGARYGGHGGGTVVLGSPQVAEDIPGFQGVTLQKLTPGSICELELLEPLPLQKKGYRWQPPCAEGARGDGWNFHAREMLEEQAIKKREKTSRRCPGLVDVIYSLPAVGVEEGGEVEIVLSQRMEGRSFHRVPIGCECRMGCRKCSKNRGNGGLCKGLAETNRVKRMALRRRAFCEQDEALHDLANRHLDEDLEHIDQELLEDIDKLPVDAEAIDEGPCDGATEVASISSFLLVDSDAASTASEASWSLL